MQATNLVVERHQMQMIRGEFNEWSAKYALAVSDFSKNRSHEACQRLKYLEGELGRIASKIF